MFNYVSFCKDLLISEVSYEVKLLLTMQESVPLTLENINILTQEIYKLFVSQITSLKSFSYFTFPYTIIFASYPGAKEFFKDLSTLRCSTDVSPEFFSQLSQICHNIETLLLRFGTFISTGLKELIGLISVQKNLKYLIIRCLKDEEDDDICLQDMIPLLTNLPNTLTRLEIHGGYNSLQLSSIAKLTNLQELELSFNNSDAFKGFEKLQYVTFPQLEILNILRTCPNHEELTNFLENNG